MSLSLSLSFSLDLILSQLKDRFARACSRFDSIRFGYVILKKKKENSTRTTDKTHLRLVRGAHLNVHYCLTWYWLLVWQSAAPNALQKWKKTNINFNLTFSCCFRLSITIESTIPFTFTVLCDALFFHLGSLCPSLFPFSAYMLQYALHVNVIKWPNTTI